MHGQTYSTINYLSQYPSKLKVFHNWGLGAASKAEYPPGTIPQEWPGLGDPGLSVSNSEPWEMRSMERTMADLGHDVADTQLSILKIDVEGAEWDALHAFFYSPKMEATIKAGKIQQLLVEWHWDPDTSVRNDRHSLLLKRVTDLGFKPWFVNRHEGSDCCLDISYVWTAGNFRA